MVRDETVTEAAERLKRAARSPARIILFGSRARGEARAGSDLDFLVIEREVRSRRKERVRLRKALHGMRLPVDLIVVSEAQVDEWGDVPGTVLYEALKEGMVVAET